MSVPEISQVIRRMKRDEVRCHIGRCVLVEPADRGASKESWTSAADLAIQQPNPG